MARVRVVEELVEREATMEAQVAAKFHGNSSVERFGTCDSFSHPAARVICKATEVTQSLHSSAKCTAALARRSYAWLIYVNRLRILYMPPVYAIISFCSYRFYRDYIYYSFIEVGKQCYL